MKVHNGSVDKLVTKLKDKLNIHLSEADIKDLKFKSELIYQSSGHGNMSKNKAIVVALGQNNNIQQSVSLIDICIEFLKEDLQYKNYSQRALYMQVKFNLNRYHKSNDIDLVGACDQLGISLSDAQREVLEQFYEQVDNLDSIKKSSSHPKTRKAACLMMVSDKNFTIAGIEKTFDVTGTSIRKIIKLINESGLEVPNLEFPETCTLETLEKRRKSEDPEKEDQQSAQSPAVQVGFFKEQVTTASNRNISDENVSEDPYKPACVSV